MARAPQRPLMASLTCHSGSAYEKSKHACKHSNPVESVIALHTHAILNTTRLVVIVERASCSGSECFPDIGKRNYYMLRAITFGVARFLQTHSTLR